MLKFIIFVILITNFVFPQDIVIPDIGEGRCVPVNPITGEPDPTACDNTKTVNEDTKPAEEKDDAEECEPPLQRDCNVECTSETSKKCTYNGPRNCNAECSHLQSYPTYEKEACITQCVDEDTADRDAYYECLNQPSSTTVDQDCINACLDEVKESEEDYENCLAEEEKTEKTEIDKKSNLPINVLYALDEYTRWNNGTKLESNAEMTNVVKDYNTAGGCPNNSPTRDPWSAAFISYVMKQSGIDFPANCAHINYFRTIKNNPGECQTHSISEKANIKSGDVICKCRGANCTIDYNNLPSGFAPSHCDIVISKDGNSVKAIGGNVGDSVKISNVNLNDPKLFGFISCEGLESKPGKKDVIIPPKETEDKKEADKPEEKSGKKEEPAKTCPLGFFVILFVAIFSFIHVRE